MAIKAVIRKILSRLRKARKLGVDDFEKSKALVLDAQLHAKNLDFDRAINTLMYAVKLSSNNDKAIALSINYKLKNNVDITEGEVRGYVLRMPDSVYILREAASWFFSKKQYQDAIEFQKKVVSRQPQVAVHYLTLSRYLAENKDYKEMLENNKNTKLLLLVFDNSQLILFSKLSLYCGDFDGFWDGVNLISGHDLTSNEKISFSKIVYLYLKMLNGDLVEGFEKSSDSVESRALDNKSFVSAFSSFYESYIYGLVRSYPSQNKKDKAVVGRNLLIVSDNWNFLSGLVLGLEENNVRVQTLNPNYVSNKLSVPSQFFGSLVGRESADSPIYILPKNTLASDLIFWADTIFIEWCNNSAFWLSWIHGLDKKIVLRVHSYEAFSVWPTVVNWHAISTIVFVSEHIKGIFEDRYLKPSGFNDSIDKVVLPNINDLSDYMSKEPSRVAVAKEVNICMVGFANANKNPLFALKLLDQLARAGVAARLHLVGAPWRDDLSVAEHEYKSRFDDFVESRNLGVRVVYIDFTDDLPSVFQSMHFIVSASQREGTHESILQAMASGVIPIIRDWPVVKPWGGASTLYGEKWLVDNVSSAVQIVNRAMVSEEVYNAYSMEAIEYSCSNFDSKYILPAYSDLLF